MCFKKNVITLWAEIETTKQTMYANMIIHGDCIENLKTIPNNSIDLIFADPPYNMQTEGELLRTDGTKFNGVSDSWDKFSSLEEYDNFTKKWLIECKRVLKDDGAIWVIGSFQNIFRLGYIMQDLGFWILNDVIWSKPNAVPNFGGTRFQNSHETLLWCSKSKKSKYHFNYKTMKVFNGGKQMKSIWDIGICIGKERLKDKYGNKVHSTQKPEALLYNVILSSTEKNDIVLDPFFGTGTTGVIAKRLGRRYIGIERNEEYILAAEKRLRNTIEESDDYINGLFEVKPPRVSTQRLLDFGYLKEGEVLYSKDKKYEVTLLNDGNVEYNGNIGSIHKISAMIKNKTNNNGWDYFYCIKNGTLISIDELRYLANNDKKI